MLSDKRPVALSRGIRSLYLLLSILLLSLSLTAGRAQAAVTVHVDPGSYAGTWSIENATSTLRGGADVTLDPGSYQVRVALLGAFGISVSSSGVVTVTNGVSATGGAGSLAFNTFSVFVDPADFSGQWAVAGVNSLTTGPGYVILVPSVGDYRIAAGGIANIGFTLSAAGTVVMANPASGTGGPQSIVLNTVTVVVDPAAFTGEWSIAGVVGFGTGPRTLKLVPGNRYFTFIAGIGATNFVVEPDGSVSIPNGVSATGGAGTVTFRTYATAIDAGPFPGEWTISRIGLFQGNQTIHLVPAVEYLIAVAAGNGPNTFRIAMNGDGTIDVPNDISGTGSFAGLDFNTEQLFFDPGSFAGSWEIQGVRSTVSVFQATGPASVHLVAGVQYPLHPGSQVPQVFSVTRPCAVVPSDFDFGGFTFSISCGLPDADQDGVPDGNDNCPSTANPEQVDQDLDGEGNLCDADLDGDGRDNLADNCPDIDNFDQTDFDGDGSGDACDADADNDQVANDLDNCPFIANTDQADSDGDTAGDACDPDDDNDGVPDLADNCAFAQNPGQSDFDGDGEGDACDGDADADGVANGGDLCALSPADLPVSSEGCTGAQLILLRCKQSDFVQHGQYVRCVAETAQEAEGLGLIEAFEKGRFVKDAAKSN